MAFALVLGWGVAGTPAQAQTTDQSVDQNGTVLETSNSATVSVEAVPLTVSSSDGTTTAAETTEIQGVTINVPSQVPSVFGLWWRSLSERVSLALTFDPIKKAEKQVKFAEERMLIAQKIAEKNPNDPVAQAKAAAMIDRANTFIDDVGKQKDTLLRNPGTALNQLLHDVAAHAAHRVEILNTIEAKLPEDKVPEFSAERHGQHRRQLAFSMLSTIRIFRNESLNNFRR